MKPSKKEREAIKKENDRLSALVRSKILKVANDKLVPDGKTGKN